jgi:hypothetical protein
MKTKLIFDNDSPDDALQLKRCLASNHLVTALWEINRLKKKLEQKFENQDNNNDLFDGIELSFSEIQKILDNWNINVDELIG